MPIVLVVTTARVLLFVRIVVTVAIMAVLLKMLKTRNLQFLAAIRAFARRLLYRL